MTEAERRAEKRFPPDGSGRPVFQKQGYVEGWNERGEYGFRVMRWALPIIGVAVVIVLVSAALPAGAQQQQCMPRDKMLQALERAYQETPLEEQAVTERGQMVEFLASPKGTWTVIITNPDGISCLAVGGNDWPFTKAKPAGEDA